MAHNLFNEFDKVSSKTWKQKIQYELKGGDYNDTLVWESPEGIKVKPFYHSDDIKNDTNPIIETISPWKIGQEIFVADAKKSNEKASDAVRRGTESLIFTIPSEDIKLDVLLSSIEINTTPIQFNLQFLSEKYASHIIELARDSNAEIYLNIDIIGNLARTGNWYYSLEKDQEILGRILAASDNKNFAKLLGIDVSLYQNAGANMVQQLAYALAHANEYLNHYALSGKQQFTFKVSVGPNYFFEIAKLRALRLLWKTLSREYGISEGCHIIAHPSKRNKTLYGYNLNMLRSTTECMASILGGANIVCNLPYDGVYHKDNEFGDRLARNQLLILKNESHLDKVTNIPAGSYYIETLTRQLAQKALSLFKDIEANGGLLKQLKEHTIQRKIKESSQKEQALFDKNEEILVGANAYANKNDLMKNDLELYPFMKIRHQKTLLEPLLEKRLSEELEQKRLKDE